MPKKKLKILGVHGLGDHRNSTWKQDWQTAVIKAFPGQDNIDLEFEFLSYDHIFENVDISAWEAMQAVWKLAQSGVSTALGGRRGVLGDVSDQVKWTAGYVVAWLEDEEFKRKTRALVLESLVDKQPDVVLAHSLGSLITYNAFTHQDAARPRVAAALRNARYVSLGSQIGNAFVIRNLSAGRIVPLPVKYWYHLYNEEDDVFTAPIKLWDASNFRQVDTYFDIDGFADHSPVEYLKHRNTIESVWRPVAELRLARGVRAFGSERVAGRRRPAAVREPGRQAKRALLVGINQYPHEQDRLEGCVNDVFRMSSVLQECSFAPASIRVCLDERATTAGITERLKWLLDDPRPGDERVFFYSGHGATIPEYGEDFEPDRKTETLVPWDFDWTPERAIVDDQIFSLYSQLPYNMRFAMILDCCHSGGMHRQGGAKVRGLNPPDDIRHRELEWNRQTNMWVPRGFKPLNRRFSSDDKASKRYFGDKGASTRIGRASLLRAQPEREYRQAKRREGIVGPYLPLIIEACAEKEFSYEYRDGATSYGAFTYALTKRLREQKRISFERLVKETGDELDYLNYKQRPQILGPKSVLSARVPWRD
ncbi:MAG: caspase family protein [Gammaproteobacteria bacterium]|nr:caspase family protein [Gammaproteobacteria bacterium]